MWNPQQRQIAVGLGLCALLIGSGFCSLLHLERLNSNIPGFIVRSLLIFIVYCVSCWLITGSGVKQLNQKNLLRGVWVAAVIFRLIILPLSPGLSEDVARYRWQGMLQHAGGNPYLDYPAEEEWEDLRDVTWTRMAGKDKSSAYGPILEQVYLWGYRAASSITSDPWQQVWLLKVLMALPDLAVGWLLTILLAAAGRPRVWALIYLWSPLTVIEFWAEGHNDAIAIVFVVTALAFSLRKKPNLALVVLTVAVLCKFWPVVLFPFLLLSREDNRWQVHWRGALASIIVGFFICIPYGFSLLEVRHVLNDFVGGWRNNDSFFAWIMLWTGGDFEGARNIVKWLMLGMLFLLRAMRFNPVMAALAAICSLLFLSANCFPWYLTWLLPLLAVYPVAPLLLWTGLSTLAYHVVIQYEILGLWRYDRTLVQMEYIPVLLWLTALVGYKYGSYWFEQWFESARSE